MFLSYSWNIKSSATAVFAMLAQSLHLKAFSAQAIRRK
jgi:hypothetical protein